MNIIFSHGKESGPFGSKIKALITIAEKYGYTTKSIDYSDTTDPEERAQRLIDELSTMNEEFILVGSSMGGYVSMTAAAQHQPKAVFLMAPALYLEGYDVQDHISGQFPVTIVHGWQDEIIPPENSIRYAQSAKCTLHLIDGDHRLTAVLDRIERFFEGFLGDLE